MIGLFDSGVGGVNALREIHKLLPGESLMLLCDYADAPYGTKSEEKIIPIIEENIRRLAAAGAEKILIACCTASAHYRALSEKARALSIPIIAPTARAAIAASQNKKIAVLATELTVRSHAFGEELGTTDFLEIEAGELVFAAEAAELGRTLDGEESDLSERVTTPREELYTVIDRLTDRAAALGADTLILGCTHFHSLIPVIAPVAREKGIKKIISSAREGALELARILKMI